MSEFEIRYTILRDDVEIGFGSALGDDVDSTLYAITSDIQCRQWETEAGQPKPEEADR